MNRKEAIQFWILGSRLHNTAVKYLLICYPVFHLLY